MMEGFGIAMAFYLLFAHIYTPTCALVLFLLRYDLGAVSKTIPVMNWQEDQVILLNY